MLSCLSLVQLFATLQTGAGQAPLFMGFSRQEYWSGLPSAPPGHLPDPATEPKSPAALTLGRFSATEPPGSPQLYVKYTQKSQSNSGSVQQPNTDPPRIELVAQW